MNKHLGLALALALTGTLAAMAQERIAVLDTELPKGIDTKVIIPVTEKIMEEFVRSKLFIVLDRSFIAKTLSELEFSTSDLTAGDPNKLATIGGFLKANYIVVSTVQKLDSTFFLSAKMIEVKTGVITAQASVNRDGSSSILIDMAGELGKKLVAAAMGQEAVTGGRAVTQSGTPAAAKAPDAPKSQKAAAPTSKRFSSVAVELGLGSTSALLKGNSYNVDLFTGSATVFNAVSGAAYGVSAIFPAGLFYLSTGLMANSVEYSGSGYSTSTTALDAGLGLGINLLFGPVQTYAGVRGSYLFMTWQEAGASTLVGDWSGFGLGYEIGADIRLGVFALGLRYAMSAGTLAEIDDYWVDMELTAGALSLRVGYAF